MANNKFNKTIIILNGNKNIYSLANTKSNIIF